MQTDGLGLLGVASMFGVWVFVTVLLNYRRTEERLVAAIAGYANWIYERLDRMFMRQPLSRCYLMIVVPAVGVGLVFFFLVVAVLGPLMSLPAALFGVWLGYKLPRLVIEFLFWRRVAKFDRQLVDVLNMMANSLKSGLSLMQVVSVIEKEMPSPSKEEFRLVLQENRLGVTLDDALMNLANRVPSEDLYMVMSSIVTLREQGGDLTETFDTIAFTIRERQKIKGKIKTMTSQGIFQASFLCGFPFLMLLIMYYVQPATTQLMWTTPLGLVFLGIMILLQVIGGYVMKRILTIDV